MSYHTLDKKVWEAFNLNTILHSEINYINNGFKFKNIADNCKSNLKGRYRIKCLENNRIYIGQGIDLKRRLWDHRRELRKGVHNNDIIQNAYNKYGEDSFSINILEIVDNIDDLYNREAFWCKYYDSFNREAGFNICPIIKDEFDRDEFAKKVMGSKNGKAKLTEKDVKEICEIINEGSLSIIQIGLKYKVRRETIKDIRKGRTWRQVSSKYLLDKNKNSWK